MAVTLLQSGKTSTDAFSASLPGATTPGSLLVAVFTRQDNSSDPTVSTSGWAMIGTSSFRGHSSFGAIGRIYWKACTATNQQTVTWTPQQGKIYIVEFGGVDAAAGEITAGRAYTQHVNTQAYTLTSGVPGVPALIVAGIVTRLNNAGNATFSPGAGISAAAPPIASSGGNGIGNLLWRTSDDGSAKAISGTQGGSTQDGYWYGMQIGAFALTPDAVGKTSVLIV